MADAALPTIVAAVLAFVGSVYAVYVQQRAVRDKSTEKIALAAEAAQTKLAADATTARVDVARDVLDQWQRIVQTLQNEVAHLHEQVLSVGKGERDCQAALIGALRQVAVLEGQVVNLETKLANLEAKLAAP